MNLDGGQIRRARPGERELSSARRLAGHPRRRGRKATATMRAVSAASRGIAATVLGSPLGLSAFSFLLGPERVQLSSLRQPVRDLSPALDGMRIVQLSDIHHSPWLPVEFLHALFERVNALRPDLVVLTGDYVSNSPRYIAPVARALERLRASAGIVGVLGNHDWYEGAELTRLEFERSGITLIDNTRVFLSPSKRLDGARDAALCIAGLGDLWEDHVDIPKALGGIAPHLPRLLLAHNPDSAEQELLTRRQYRVDLMLCGHTHGGQVRLPIIGAPHVPSDFGQKYDRGLVDAKACPVFISRGIGTSGVPVRFGAPPEIVLVELVRDVSPVAHTDY